MSDMQYVIAAIIELGIVGFLFAALLHRLDTKA